jgi:hypothetical protein
MACSTADKCLALSDAYYQAYGIVPGGARSSLDQWKSLNKFSDSTIEESRASYYNRGDLAIGRDMHCKTYRLPDAGLPFTFATLACYVSNYGDGVHAFGTSDPGKSIANAVAAGQPLATVVMEGTYVVDGPNYRVADIMFAVYNNDGLPIKAAILDSSKGGANEQAVPGTCLSCHGGNGGYDAQGRRQKFGATGYMVVREAHFLAFDPSQFLFGDGTRLVPNAAEQEAFRKLNSQIRAAYALVGNSDLTRDLIDGWYSWCGGVDKPSCTIDEVNHAFVPSGACTADTPGSYKTCGWTTGRPKFADKKPAFDMVEFYKRVPARYCRGCHIAGPQAFNVQNFKSWSSGSLVDIFVRQNHTMPFAEATFNGFWQDQGAVRLLSQYLDDVALPTEHTVCLNKCAAQQQKCNQIPGNTRRQCTTEWRECVQACP